MLSFNYEKDVVYSIVCEKCLPIGTYVLVHEPWMEFTLFSEIGIIGLPIDMNL